MRKLTDKDLANIAGSAVGGYVVEAVRAKRGEFSDSGHYGIILARNARGHYVTWQFHLDGNDGPDVYWGHYFMENRKAAVKDFNERDLDNQGEADRDLPMDGGTQPAGPVSRYKVTITETLQRAVTVEAGSRDEARQLVSDQWKNGGYILTSDDFTGVEFEAAPTCGKIS